MTDFILNPALERMGTESAFTLAARVAKAESQGVNVINLGLGQPDFQTPAHIVEAAIQALKDGRHGYTPPLGIVPLRKTVADYLTNRYQFSADHECVAIMPGGKPTMNFAITLFGQAGAEIMYPDPAFPIYRSMINYTGAKAVAVPMRAKNNFEIDITDIAERITTKTRLLIVNSPHNPTGSVMSEQTARKLEVLLQEYPDCTIMTDEIYSHFTFGNQEHFSLLNLESLRERMILLDGFSKSFAMTGWRLGFSLWPKALMPYIFQLAVNSYSCPNAPAQYAGIVALEGDKKPIYDMSEQFAKRAAFMHKRFNNMPNVTCVAPQGAFYIFPDFSNASKLDSNQLSDKFLFEYGVAGLSANGFGDECSGHIRFSCVADETDLVTAMDRIEKCLQE